MGGLLKDAVPIIIEWSYLIVAFAKKTCPESEIHDPYLNEVTCLHVSLQPSGKASFDNVVPSLAPIKFLRPMIQSW